MTTAPQVAIAYEGSTTVLLWCRVGRRHADGTLEFHVLNGNWDGVLKDGYVLAGGVAVGPRARIVWEGRAPFDDYNRAMVWIQAQVTP